MCVFLATIEGFMCTCGTCVIHAIYSINHTPPIVRLVNEMLGEGWEDGEVEKINEELHIYFLILKHIIWHKVSIFDWNLMMYFVGLFVSEYFTLNSPIPL